MMALAEAPLRSSYQSECTRYRYSLYEELGRGTRAITWVMLNPPVLDEVADRTARHVGNFARRWGYEQMTIVNLFACRAANPHDLALAEDPVGPENRWFVHQAVTDAELVVVGWGDGVGCVGTRPKTLDDLVDLRRANAAMLCFGLTDSGNPVHPASVPDSTIPIVWTAR